MKPPYYLVPLSAVKTEKQYTASNNGRGQWVWHIVHYKYSYSGEAMKFDFDNQLTTTIGWLAQWRGIVNFVSSLYGAENDFTAYIDFVLFVSVPV